MKKWMLLAGAIATEVTASLSLKAALAHPAFYAVVVTGYIAAFVFLTFVMGVGLVLIILGVLVVGAILSEGIALGVAYGIWAAAGIALTAVLSKFIFKEPFTLIMADGIARIVGGVLLVELGAH